ncbi:MAG: hypothetical protein UT24_C0012G0120 [Candidatus Woesebacteria bacterium GW2011_GWB1_39_12]|uniref:Uncharacterized protein n=2 Tax=Candidatus Woeseibacteriota TaxID=1752722 RepID=A0A0G0M0X0_9BACT|nr:MAG: hypothetical protein UT23_C0008G0081 [Candidatus Woesebacteria bacterium GW2011_GWA1_39_12]KKR00498.1 MAG: hypothetical protein UT24_C0012G0120 [Candidatus Woesebacteria bacterium GW2011_GWB1_39_12]
MKKALLSLFTIGVIAVIAVFATQAFFSDTETSKGNVLQAGAIDLKVDYDGYYNKEVDGHPNAGTWELKDLTLAEKFFDLRDIKPGDFGEGTISLHVYDNNAWGCVNIIPTHNDDVTTNEPELEAGDVANTDSLFDGELAQNMQFKIWADICSPAVNPEEEGAEPGDNIYQEGCDRLLTEGTGPLTPTTWALADSVSPNVFTGLPNDPLVGSNNYYLGVAWNVPGVVGNIIQTDKYMADVSFYVEQSRNNTKFVCPSVEPKPNTLRLENEVEVQGGPWTVLDQDQIYADLTWAGDSATFNYTLTGKGLAPTTDYALIYYADGWPGNNPGAFIGEGTTNASGDIAFAGNPDLGVDLPTLPDGNFATGAKIWLVLSADYNGGNPSTGPMTAWNPGSYLFEGNVYVHYNDTDN